MSKNPKGLTFGDIAPLQVERLYDALRAMYGYNVRNKNHRTLSPNAYEEILEFHLADLIDEVDARLKCFDAVVSTFGQCPRERNPKEFGTFTEEGPCTCPHCSDPDEYTGMCSRKFENAMDMGKK